MIFEDSGLAWFTMSLMALVTGEPGTGFIWRILATAPQGGPGELREHGRLREVKHLAEVTQKVLELGF